MTYLEAQSLVYKEKKQTYYSTSPLNVGKVDIVMVGEDGFVYRRETEYIEVVGIAEILCDNFTVDIDKWNFSEIVVRRKKDISVSYTHLRAHET